MLLKRFQDFFKTKQEFSTIMKIVVMLFLSLIISGCWNWPKTSNMDSRATDKSGTTSSPLTNAYSSFSTQSASSDVDVSQIQVDQVKSLDMQSEGISGQGTATVVRVNQHNNACHYPSEAFASVSTASVDVPMSNGGARISMPSLSAIPGNQFKISVDTSNVKVTTYERYRVIYRLDPRFTSPQVFVAAYDFASKTYDPLWDTYTYGGVTYDNINLLIDAFTAKSAYKYKSTVKPAYKALLQPTTSNSIAITSGDVVTIRQLAADDFWSSASKVGVPTSAQYTPDTNAIGTSKYWLRVYTESIPGLDNQIYCINANTIGATGNFFVPTSTNAMPSLFVGYLNGTSVTTAGNPNNTYTLSSGSVCDTIPTDGKIAASCSGYQNYVFNRGYPVAFIVGGATYSSPGTTATSPMYQFYSSEDILANCSNCLATSILQFTATTSGYLTFQKPWSKVSSGTSDTVFIPDFVTTTTYDNTSLTSFHDTFTQASYAKLTQVCLGRYLFEIDVGGGASNADSGALSNLTFTYYIGDSSSATTQQSGTFSNGNPSIISNVTTGGPISIDVPEYGGSAELIGDAVVTVAVYTNNNVVSSFLYNNIVGPVKALMFSSDASNTALTNSTLSYLVFQGLVQNSALQRLISISMAFFVLFSALSFLIGATTINLDMFIKKVVRLIVVSMVLNTSTAWGFFTTYLFNMFETGADYFIGNISQQVTDTNPFSFMDGVVDTYFSPMLWKMIGFYVMSCSGYTGLAIILISGIIQILKAMVNIVVAYISIFIILCVLIGFTPIIIIALMFERTKGMIDKWIMMMMSYMFQPMITLIFFLFVENIVANLLQASLVRICNQKFIDLGLDFGTISVLNIKLKVSFGAIYAYLPSPDVGESFLNSISAAFVFLCMTQLLEKSVQMGETIGGLLLNVTTASASQAGQQISNAVNYAIQSAPMLAALKAGMVGAKAGILTAKGGMFVAKYAGKGLLAVLRSPITLVKALKGGGSKNDSSAAFRSAVMSKTLAASASGGGLKNGAADLLSAFLSSSSSDERKSYGFALPKLDSFADHSNSKKVPTPIISPLVKNGANSFSDTGKIPEETLNNTATQLEKHSVAHPGTGRVAATGLICNESLEKYGVTLELERGQDGKTTVTTEVNKEIMDKLSPEEKALAEQRTEEAKAMLNNEITKYEEAEAAKYDEDGFVKKETQPEKKGMMQRFFG